MAKTTTRAKADEQNTEGAVDTGVTAPGAPTSEPAGTSAPAPAGEAVTGLPGSDQDAAVVTPTTIGFLDAHPVPDAAAGEITVICHAPGGRRRLGRRWPAGKAFVPLADLSDTDIELLRADPQFSVILPAA